VLSTAMKQYSAGLDSDSSQVLLRKALAATPNCMWDRPHHAATDSCGSWLVS
jgi:hypothetical protein